MTAVICAYNRRMSTLEEVEGLLRVTPVFRRLSPDDRRRVAQATSIRRFDKGEMIFEQDTPSDAFYTIASGRVKIFKMLRRGRT